MTQLLWDTPTDGVSPDSAATLLLAHGAGAAMDSAGMNAITSAVVARGIRVARFEFGYMAGRREGVRKPPPRGESLVGEYRDAVAEAATTPLFVGGHSLGGRVASMVAQELYDAGVIAGLVCFSYPFHPPGKPEQLRTAHLLGLTVPTVICQGTRDEFGTPEEVPGYGLSPAIGVHWLGDGDHSLRPRKAISGRTYAQNLAEAAETVAGFVAKNTGP